MFNAFFHDDLQTIAGEGAIAVVRKELNIQYLVSSIAVRNHDPDADSWL